MDNKLNEEFSTIESLKKELKEKDKLIELFTNEKNESELLSFPWVGNLGQWYWLVATNQVYFNEKKVSNLGYESNEIPPFVDFQFFTEKLYKDDYERVMTNMRNHLSGKTESYEVEYRIRAKDNTYKWYHDRGKITKRDEDGKPLIVSGIVFDISRSKQIESELKEANHKLTQLLIHDDLTKIYNRRFLLEQLNNLIKEKNPKFSLILFDIDHFKLVNDKYGHDVGDKVLIQVCKVANDIISNQGYLCRFGGEEFVILLKNSSLKQSVKIAQKVRKSIEKCPLTKCESVTASFGVSIYRDGQDINQLIKTVDSLMFSAKNSGRNCVKF
jgi:diguanylate cyclase (GGDEF)-like protein/PAS domain S-box-containing protein